MDKYQIKIWVLLKVSQMKDKQQVCYFGGNFIHVGKDNRETVT